LRQPYWDWGFELTPPDELLTKTEVDIVNYNGLKTKVPNPLLRYHFHPVDPSFNTGDPNFRLRNSPVTVRNPDENFKEDIPALIKSVRFYVTDRYLINAQKANLSSMLTISATRPTRC